MRKLKKGRKFHREKDQRRAFLRSLARALVLKEKIKTTVPRAKELAPFVEKAITESKKGDLKSKRNLTKKFSEEISDKLINEIAPRYKNRKGGYTRIIKLGPRQSDGAPMAIIELLK